MFLSALAFAGALIVSAAAFLFLTVCVGLIIIGVWFVWVCIRG